MLWPNSYISLISLEIYIADDTAGGAAKTGLGTAQDWTDGSPGTRVYDLDMNDDVTVLMDYMLWQGSGQNVDTLA